jgi:hypothetical protein
MISNRTRYLVWQLPMLLLLPAAFSPEMAWLSPAIGFWPLWLAAMPATAWLLARLSKPVESSPGVTRRASQVLVFQVIKTPSSKPLPASRHAA